MDDELFHPAMFASHESVEQAFYDALERGDADALMACWADEDDIVCIHPNGPRLVGQDAIRRSWTHIFSNGPVHVRPVALHVQQAMMVSIHSVVEQVAIRTPQGAAVANVFATNVYIKTPNGWRMVLHHASPVPDDAMPELAGDPAAPRPQVLH